MMNLRFRFFSFLILGSLLGCNGDLKNWVGSSKSPPATSTLNVTSVDVRNNLVKFTGIGLDQVKSVGLKNATPKFLIASQSATEIQASVSSPLSLVVGTAYTFLLSSASGDTSIPVTFDELWDLSGSNISYTVGDVGIGTTTPTDKLSVIGQVAIDNTAGGARGCFRYSGTALEFSNNCDNGTPSWSAIGASGGDNLGNHIATTNIQLNNNWLSNDGGAEGIRVDNSGNVGIGIATPQTLLDVRGANSAPIGNMTNANLNVVSTNAPANDVGGSLQFSGQVSAGIYYGLAAIKSGVTTTGFYGSYLTFNVNNNGNVFPERMRINQDGNVGIGTPGPAARLHVYEPTDLGGTIGNFQLLSRVEGHTGNTVAVSDWLYRDTTAVVTWSTARIHNGLSVDGTSFLTPGVDTKTWWERDPSDNIQSWGNAATTYMTINAGYVGIGTPGPSSILDVNGAITVREIAAPAVAPVNQGRIYFDSTADQFKVSENFGAYRNMLVKRSGFRVKLSVDQTLADSANPVVLLDTEDYDLNNEFDTTTYRFTPTSAGYYSFVMMLSWAGNVVGTRSIYIRKNGTIDTFIRQPPPPAAGLTIQNISAIIYLNGTTDYIDVTAAQDSGGNLNISSGLWSHLTGHKIAE